MVEICPTITAYDPHEYRDQINRVSGFAKRLHIDLMDGHFAPTVSPPLGNVWWPKGITADIHLMYSQIMQHIETLVALKPHLVIVHAEVSLKNDLDKFFEEINKYGIKTGLALLPETSIEQVKHWLAKVQHVLIFSGKLGYHGGQANLEHLQKVKALKALNSQLEISWDGGIDANNAKQLVDGGVTVLNVGGYIQKADNPEANYQKLAALIQS